MVDKRLDTLAEISKTKETIYASVKFVDIAGLVKGAAEGQGLGNKFLANIRETDAIAQVVRAFDNDDVLHVDGSVNPVRDAETINTELALADLDVLGKRLGNAEKQKRSGTSKQLEAEMAVLTKAIAALNEGTMLRDVTWSEDEFGMLKLLMPLTLKAMIYVVNVSEEQLGDGSWKSRVEGLKGTLVPVCIKMEADLASMNEAEKKEYLEMVGQTESGLDRLIKCAYDALGLITFLTSGKIETRAWTIVKGTKAPQAAGKIHSDFEKHFIRVEVTAYEDYAREGGEAACKAKALTRTEGKEYVMQDGDVCYFKVDA